RRKRNPQAKRWHQDRWPRRLVPRRLVPRRRTVLFRRRISSADCQQGENGPEGDVLPRRRFRMTDTVDLGLILAVFAATYTGMALGRFPGLSIDRAGIALLAAIVLAVTGAVTPASILGSIDFPTLFVLFGLMILSAQFDASGFYDWCSLRIASLDRSPAWLLGAVVAVSGLLSAVLANDVVVFAMTPLLCAGLLARGLDPRPYLIGLAGGANAGSA